MWDVKSASDWAFNYKFTGMNGGYDKLKEDDPFGYVMQGFLYAEATGLPFGGGSLLTSLVVWWLLLKCRIGRRMIKKPI